MTRHVEIVLAVSDNKVIGRNNCLPWEKPIPADMQHFRDLTMGKTVVMGRATHQSIGRLLPRRHNVVLGSRALEGAELFSDLDDVLQAYQECVVIGGSVLCNYMLQRDMIDVAHITEVHATFAGDVIFNIGLYPKMKEVSREYKAVSDDNPYPLSFVTYRRED